VKPRRPDNAPPLSRPGDYVLDQTNPLAGRYAPRSANPTDHFEKLVDAEIRQLPIETLLKLEGGETITVAGDEIAFGDVEIRRTGRQDRPHVSTHYSLSIEIDPTITPAQLRMGLARELIRKIQAARKHAGLQLDDRISLKLLLVGPLMEAAQSHDTMIRDSTLARALEFTDHPTGDHVETVETEEGPITIGLRRL
jgi:isoleucyl-tRNA synthetase